MSTPTQAACRWFYAHDRKKVGPLTLEELRELAGRGELQPADMLLPEGATRWHPAAEVPAIFETGTTIPPDQAVTTPHIPLAQPAFPPVPGYEMLGELGRGGMGVVYKARQLKLNRTVALKMIRSGAHAGAQERARFLIEAEAVARLSHPNIVQIFEVGEHDGCPFFSLEYVEGGSLSRQVAGTPQPPRDAAVVAEALARALQHAHLHGIIHRDLKPANVLLSFSREPLASADSALARGSRLNDCVPKVTDFGLARRLEEEDERLTRSGVVMGTPSYMAPEQARGQAKDVGPPCDVWALGAILYDLLTGRPPFKGANSAETLLLVTTAEPVSPRQLNPSVPRDLETICLKCLQKEPARRYSSAGELADDLKRFLGGLPIKARPVGRVARTWRWCRRNPVLAVVTSALVLALVGGVSGIALKWREAVVNSRLADENAAAERVASTAKGKALEEKEIALKDVQHRLNVEHEFNYASQMVQLWQDWQLGDTATILRRLEAFLPRSGQKDVRGFEWHVCWKMMHGSRLTLLGHNQSVSDLAFSPDGRLLASGGHDTQMRIWDVATGKELHSKTIDSFIRNLAFAPDGKTLFITWQFRNFQAYDLATKTLGPIQLNDGVPTGRNHVVVSPDGRFLFFLTRSITIRDVRTDKDVATLPVAAADLAFTPDGRLVCPVGGALHVYGPSGGDWGKGALLLHRVEVYPGPIAHFALSGDIKTLVTIGTSGWTPKVWTLEPDKPPVLRATLRTCPPFGHMALSPDGKRLFMAGTDRVIRVWDVPTGIEIASLRGHAKDITGLAISSDGRHLASGSKEGTVKVWDLNELPSAGPATNAPTNPRAVALDFSPDNRFLATGGRDAVVRVWDLATQRRRLALRGHESAVLGVCFLGDGRELLSVGRAGDVRRWDLERGRALAQRKLGVEISCAAVSASGGDLACGDSEGRLWLLSSQRDKRLSGRPHWTRVTALAFAPGGKRLLSGAWDGSVSLTDVLSGASWPCMPLLWSAIACVSFTLDGKKVLASQQEGLYAAWDPDTREPLGMGSATPQRALVRHPQGRWLAGAQDAGLAGQVLLGERGAIAFTGRDVAQPERQVAALACSRDGSLLAVADEAGTVSVLTPRTDHQLWPVRARLPGHAHATYALAYAPDGQWLARGEGVVIRLMEAAGRRQRAVLTGHTDVIEALAFAPDGRTLATGGAEVRGEEVVGVVRLWEVPSGKPLALLEGAREPVRTLLFAPDGRTLVSGGGRMNGVGELLLWDVGAKKLQAVFPEQRWIVRGLAFLSDGRTLVSVSGNNYSLPGDLKLWDVAARKELFSFSPHSKQIMAVALSPDGKLLATGGRDDTVRLWELRGVGAPVLRTTLHATSEVRPLESHITGINDELRASFGSGTRVRKLAFSPDGRTLAACGTGRTIYLWRPELGESVGSLEAPGDVGAIAFAPDGRTLAVEGLDGELTLFRAATAEEVRRAAVSGTPTDPGEDLRRETERLRVRALRNLAAFHAREGDPKAQRQTLDKALAEVNRLLSRSPLTPTPLPPGERGRGEGNRRELQAEQAELLMALGLLPGTDLKEQERLSVQAAEVVAKLLAAEPSQPRLLFLRANALVHIAFLRFRDKRHEQALAPATESIGLFRRLAERDPEDWMTLRWAAYSLGLQGAIQAARGQQDLARTSYREAAAVSELGVARLPSPSAQLLAYLRRSLAAFVQLSLGHPSPGAPRTLAQQREVVEAWLHCGELDDQMALFTPNDVALRTRAVDWRRLWRFVISRPYARDRSLRLEEADESFRRAIAHCDALIKMAPGENKYRRERLKCFEEWGNLMKEKGEHRRAEKAYAQLVAAARAERDRPPGKDFHADVYVALRLQAEVVADQGRYGDACALLRQALRESTWSMSVVGKTATMQHNHALLLRELALDEMLRKDHAAAFAALNECFSLALTRSEDWWKAGKLLVTCQLLAHIDGKLSAADKERAAERYAGRAVDALRLAVALNPKLRRLLAKDKEWDSLRQREDFKKLLMK